MRASRTRLFFKLQQAQRAEMAWRLSADLGRYGALRTGSATLEALQLLLGLQESSVRMLLAVSGSMGIVRWEGGSHTTEPMLRPIVLASHDWSCVATLRRRSPDELSEGQLSALRANAPSPRFHRLRWCQ